MGKNSKRFALSALIAAIAGYLTGILTAPKSGRETRQDIKNTADKGITEAEKQLKTLHTELNTALGKAKNQSTRVSGKAKTELDSAIETGRKVKDKARAVLSAVHEGDSEDQELQAAIKDVQSAIKNLKSYIKK